MISEVSTVIVVELRRSHSVECVDIVISLVHTFMIQLPVHKPSFVQMLRHQSV
jgi:hypothetical protein